MVITLKCRDLHTNVLELCQTFENIQCVVGPSIVLTVLLQTIFCSLERLERANIESSFSGNTVGFTGIE